MNLAVDLHSHSGYAGGVGDVPLSRVAATMRLKGIDVFGTGDCLFPPRLEELRNELREHSSGLFRLSDSDRDFMLQTEVILSVSLPGHKRRTVAHHVILFPSFESVERMQALMGDLGSKNTVGRPWIVSRDRGELIDTLYRITAIDPWLEIIPAHLMTPDGVYGSDNNLTELAEFYGDFLPGIRACETGLSADPAMLAQIPDLCGRTLVSFGDGHSAALDRIGREFTVLDVESGDYPGIISALRTNRVVMTAEFEPSEGRYFKTGHHPGTRGRLPHDSVMLFGDNPPGRCPVCGKPVLPGVEARCRKLSRPEIVPPVRNFMHLVPLPEVVAHSLGVRSTASNRVTRLTLAILERFESEVNLWRSPPERIQELLDNRAPVETLRQILAVQGGRFRFDPPGCDGQYGVLRIDQPQ